MAVSNESLMAKLFKWTTITEYNGVKFYQRIVGDSVLDDARREALLAARKLRRSLRDVDSTEYLIYLDPLEDLSDEELKTGIVAMAMRDVMREYMQTTPRPSLDPISDNPTQEEQENYEAAKQERDDTYVNDMTAYVEDWQKGFEKTLEPRDHTALMNLAKKYRVDQACEQEYSDAFEDHVVSASIYTDDKYKTRLFTLEQYKELPSELKLLLRNAYNNITIDPDTLKN
jgi:hypothetical protein